MRLALLALIALTGCPGRGGAYPQPPTLSSAKDVISHLATTRAARTSFKGESVMDYWVGNNRLKGTVLVMGTSQRQVRFNALSPQGGGVLVDMACNGTDFTMVDYQNNCVVTGPCTGASIASLLHVQLEPEDFLALALGTPPVIDQAAGKTTWDASKGRASVNLAAPAGTETIVIDGRDGRTDVVSSELIGRDGKVVWSVENADFDNVKEASGGQQRLPNKTRFKSPGQQADLLVEWKERVLNVELEPSKFVVTVTPGLATCPH